MDVSSCRLVLRAIVGEKLAGFPKQDELKSVFVEHEIERAYVDYPCIRKDFALHGAPAFLRTWTTRVSERTSRCTARVFARRFSAVYARRFSEDFVAIASCNCAHARTQHAVTQHVALCSV